MTPTTKSKILPPRDDEGSQAIGLRMPVSMVKQLDKVADASGHSRSEVMLYFLKWALQEYELEQQESSTPAKKK